MKGWVSSGSIEYCSIDLYPSVTVDLQIDIK